MSEDVDVRTIAPAGNVRAEVRVPGSKSHTNRSLIIAALSEGASVLEGALHSDDTEAMVAALAALGYEIETDWAARRISVTGCGGAVPADRATVDARDSGTTMRFVTALAALGAGQYALTGSARMRQRPIGDLLDALSQLGVVVRCPETDGYPPLEIDAHGIAGGRARIGAGTSSQFVSALLLASPCAKDDVTIELTGDVVSKPFIRLTISLMREHGADVTQSPDGSMRVGAPKPYRAGTHAVEGDATAASYFWAAAAVTGGRVTVRNVGTSSLQGDAAFPDVLERMGCTVERSVDAVTVSAPQGALRGGSSDLNGMPDTAQTLAVVALFADGPTEISNVGNLRVKECDRIAALAAELPKLGARVEEHADGLAIMPPEKVHGARIATYDDHRMAMSFAVAGLVVDGLEIENPRCVEKTYPEFFDDFDKLGKG